MYYGAVEAILINLGGVTIVYTQDLMNSPVEELLILWISYISGVWKAYNKTLKPVAVFFSVQVEFRNYF